MPARARSTMPNTAWTASRKANNPRSRGRRRTSVSTTASSRGMGDTMAHREHRGDNGHLGSVDETLAREHRGRPSTWHGRRYGHAAVNVLAARIIRVWRRCGNVAELAEWVRPIEEALAPVPDPGS